MAYQAVFQRYELKYILTQEQKMQILTEIEPYMKLDQYGRTTIRNIYFDTDSFRLIRRSIEKPAYKEKLRIRSYANGGSADKVFVELKKKYEKVVYKRRLSMPEETAIKWLNGEAVCNIDSQIAREIDFRITFDENVLCREEDMTFQKDNWGIPVLEEDKVLMELKCSGGIPLWMVEVLSKEKIYKTSFSKYGTAYQRIIYPKMKGEQR